MKKLETELDMKPNQLLTTSHIMAHMVLLDLQQLQGNSGDQAQVAEQLGSQLTAAASYGRRVCPWAQMQMEPLVHSALPTPPFNSKTPSTAHAYRKELRSALEPHCPYASLFPTVCPQTPGQKASGSQGKNPNLWLTHKVALHNKTGGS